MAKFNFRLQSVLNLKKSLENQQRNVFAAQRKALSDEEEKLEKLYVRLSDYEEEGRKLRESVLNIQDLLDNEVYLVRVKEYIALQKEEVRKASEKLEEERLKLIEMMKERKMYERLREKAFDEFIEEEKHSEAVSNDEHNSYVYGIKEA